MKKLLFFDIDGTLLDSQTRDVPQSAMDAIEQAKAMGHELFFCTGRSWGMRNELAYIGIDSAIICNGAGIVRQGTLIYEKPIDQDIALKTLEAIEALNGGYQAITWRYGYQNDKMYDVFTPGFLRSYKDRDLKDVFLQKGMHRWSEYPGDPILKIDYIFDTREQRDTFLKNLDPSIDGITMISYFPHYTGYYGEIMHKDANKGNGVVETCKVLDIPISQTVAFGDSLNDEPMLEAAHISVVMGDGRDEIKAKADFVTKAVSDDGIAYAMKELDII